MRRSFLFLARYAFGMFSIFANSLTTVYNIKETK
jgi:hypothetical protein